MSIEEIYNIVIKEKDISIQNIDLRNLLHRKIITEKYNINQSVVRVAHEYHLPEVFTITEFGKTYIGTDIGKFTYYTFNYYVSYENVTNEDIANFVSSVKKEYRDSKIDDILS